MTKAAIKGVEQDDDFDGSRGSFVEVDAGCATRPLPRIRIDGPYGAPAEDVFDNEVAILIGAGIGMSVRHSLAFVNLIRPRGHTFCLYPQTYLVSTEGRKYWFSPQSRILLGLP